MDHRSPFLDIAHEPVVIGTGDVMQKVSVKENGCDLHEYSVCIK